MAEALIPVTAGSGTNIHSWSKTIGANTVHDQAIFNGEYPYASYTVIASTISVATSTDHILEIMAGSTLNVKIRRIRIEQLANATTAALDSFLLMRVTTAGTGGTAITPGKLDNSDSAAGCTAMTLPSSKGSESTEIRRETLVMRQAFLTTAAQPEESIEWDFDRPRIKPLIIAAGTSNGICIKNGSAIAGATVIVYVELTEQNFV